VDLTIRKGEITFIVGGNGSGKSTLSKLITLHYRATGGAIRFGDQDVSDNTIGALRQQIGAIYSDYYLFDRVLGLKDRDDLDDTVQHYLKALQLDHKVHFRDGAFSTLSLSDGQRRRMALLVAILDDKELYLFDEWAADQDPSFKAVFYNGILPALRQRGKAVVTISHDDRYFNVADQVIVLEEGRIARDVHTNSMGAAEQAACAFLPARMPPFSMSGSEGDGVARSGTIINPRVPDLL
jgi:putative ATP-binding cassette transporter